MFYTIYQTTNLINNKIYIGKHITDNVNDNYLGSGIILVNAIKKYGKENFSKEILFVFDSEEDMNNKEREIIDINIINDDKYYNIALGGYGGCVVLHKDHPKYFETKSKLAESHRNNRDKTSERVKELHKQKKVGMYGKKQSEYQKQRVSETLKGKKGKSPSEESKAKYRETMKRKASDPNYKHPLKGRKHTEESIKRMSERQSGENNGMFGKTQSDETRKKIAEKAKRTTQCPHCLKMGSVSNMTRWHFDNCKSQNVSKSSIS